MFAEHTEELGNGFVDFLSADLSCALGALPIASDDLAIADGNVLRNKKVLTEPIAPSYS